MKATMNAKGKLTLTLNAAERAMRDREVDAQVDRLLNDDGALVGMGPTMAERATLRRKVVALWNKAYQAEVERLNPAILGAYRTAIEASTTA